MSNCQDFANVPLVPAASEKQVFTMTTTVFLQTTQSRKSAVANSLVSLPAQSGSDCRLIHDSVQLHPGVDHTRQSYGVAA